MYIITMILSAFNLVCNIWMLFSEPDGDVFKFYGAFESYIVLFVSIICLLIGIVNDMIKERRS